MPRKYLLVLLHVFGIAFGGFAIVAGEMDDSPGLQGIGLILILSIVFRRFKMLRNN